MKDFGATIVIKFPVTFKADNMADARSRVREVGKSMLAERISSSSLVEISANNLQEILIFEDKEEN